MVVHLKKAKYVKDKKNYVMIVGLNKTEEARGIAYPTVREDTMDMLKTLVNIIVPKFH